MKLTKELKAQIDKFFNNVTADELYQILTKKYGLIEIDMNGFNSMQELFVYERGFIDGKEEILDRLRKFIDHHTQIKDVYKFIMEEEKKCASNE